MSARRRSQTASRKKSEPRVTSFGMKQHCHPQLMKQSQIQPGFYMNHTVHKNIRYHEKPGGGGREREKMGYISIGDQYQDPFKRGGKMSTRFGGKQFLTNPGILTEGAIGYFSALGVNKPYKPDTYQEQNPYFKTQPPDKRKLGFGSHDAAKRDEFMVAVRTEQYREQLRSEARILKEIEENNKKRGLTHEVSMVEQKATFPTGLKPTKHLYDIGRGNETAFDPRASRDTFYNNLMNKNIRSKTMRRTGGAWLSSCETGAGIAKLDHAQFKAAHGHVRATKTFFDRSHLNIGQNLG